MAATPEELAYELSRATFDGQAQTESALRDRAIALLQAASVVVPFAGIAISKGPTVVAVPFVLAVVSYGFCAYFCASVLFPGDVHVGISGAAFLEDARESDANLTQMHATAASYLDQLRERNSRTLSGSAERLTTAIRWLVAELSLLAASLVVTIVS
jgi:hypothetical protein